MLSLKNAYIPNSLREAGDHSDWVNANVWPDGWDSQIRSWAQGVAESIRNSGRFITSEDIRYTAELKVDGLSLALRYEQRRLVTAVTRGDGEVGEVVTENARTIADIPIELPPEAPERIEIRGEVFLSRKRWEELNAQLDSLDQLRFANPRNAASGTLKLLDSREVARRRLSFLPWQVLGAENHEKSLVEISDWGFSRMPRTTSGNIDWIVNFTRQQAIDRLALPFDTDGVVIKIQSREIQETLGATEHHPRWALAFKFPALQVTTTVLRITWQVGRTGKLTPVAELEPVDLAGSTIKRVTLNNIEFIRKLGLRIGSRIFIEKGGDVIPKVVSLVPGQEVDNFAAPTVPDSCPVCTGEIREVRTETSNRNAEDKKWTVTHFCENPECPAKLEGRFLHFGSRSALEIEGLGDAVAAQLAESKRFQHPWEILELLDQPLFGVAFFNSLEGFAELSAKNLFDAIHESLKKPLWRWVHALGIPNVGESTSRILSLAFPSLNLLWQVDEYTPLAIETIGPEVGKALKVFAEQHPNLPAQLAAYGVAPTPSEPEVFRTITLDTWLSSIGIAELGPVTARKLVQALGGFPELWASNEEGILRHIAGKKILKRGQEHIPVSLAEFSKIHPKIPQQLELLGVTSKQEKSVMTDELPLSGQTCVVTGTLATLSREEAEARLRKLGARVVGSVSAKTSFLVVGDNAGSNKLISAQTFGIPVKDEAWLLDLLDEKG